MRSEMRVGARIRGGGEARVDTRGSTPARCAAVATLGTNQANSLRTENATTMAGQPTTELEVTVVAPMWETRM